MAKLDILMIQPFLVWSMQIELDKTNNKHSKDIERKAITEKKGT
jgi:hypothetical protein